MDVQSEAIPLILGGGDVLMAAETGSGKTGAFCLPIIQIVWETLKDLEAGKGNKIIATTCKFQLFILNDIYLCNLMFLNMFSKFNSNISACMPGTV